MSIFLKLSKMYYGPERKRNRSKNYDYSSEGYYFVTICTTGRISYFGEIADRKMILNEYGSIAQEEIIKTQELRNEILIDSSVIMPNHLHVIVCKKSGTSIYNEISQQNERGSRGRLQSTPTEELDNAEHSGSTQCFDAYGALGLHGNHISSVIRALKSGITRNIRQDFGDYEFSWQRSFHDRIIRNEEQLQVARKYIQENPLRWEEDVNNLEKL